MIQSFTAINAHSRCQIYGLALTQPNKLASIGLDSYIRVWDLANFTIEHSIKLKHSYLSSIFSNEQHLIIGNGQGELMFFDKSTLTKTNILKIHDDCINDIKIFNNKIFTTSNDGTIGIVDLQKNNEFIKIEAGSPLKFIQQHKNSYFVSGIQSYELDQQLNIKQTVSVNKFVSKSGKLYGTNEQNGFFCISKQPTYIPCENITQFSKGILGFSRQTLSYFNFYQDSDQISFGIAPINNLDYGDSILSMISIGNRVIAGSQCGKIYTFNVNEEQKYSQ